MNKILLKVGIIILAIIIVLFAISFIFRLTNSNNSNAIKESDTIYKFDKAIQINILNSTKHSGIADISRNYMRNKGFDVVEIGNYAENQKKSIVIDRIGDKKASQFIAKTFGIPDSMIISKIDSNLFISASIILGEDYHLFPAFLAK